MRLLTFIPSRTSTAVSLETTLATLSKAVLFMVIILLPTISAQDVTVEVSSNSAVFNNSDDEFERICHYQGTSLQFDHLEWLLNGTFYERGITGTTIKSSQLLIRQVNFSHAGQWECRAVFSGGAAPIVASAGILTVFDPNDVTAPPQQYTLVGQNYTLQCSYVTNVAFISWLRNDQRLSTGAAISSAKLSDEGEYKCRVSVSGARIEKSIQLNVIVPPRILSFPQFDQSFGNEQVTLTVTFQSHQEAITTVSWFKNDIPISTTNITTRYGPAPNASTELHFAKITRENQGQYRVVIENTAGIIPAQMRMAVSEFDVDVRVPPSRPTAVTITAINDTHVRIAWTLTNQTIDAGAERLTLNLQNHPNSPFQLKPNQVEWILYSEPGMMYNLTLKAANPDGEVTTDPMAVKLPPTAPAVETFRALRVNNSAFNFTLEVAYTGGGAIQQFSIRLQQSNTFVPIATVIPIQSQTSSRVWYAVVTDSVFDGLEEPRFDVNVVNAMEQSVLEQVQGEVVLPGPPSIFLVSQSSDSLTLQIQLSDIGTAPILMVEMNITLGSQLMDTMDWTGSFTQGELIDVPVTGLQPSTSYTFRARAVNKHGTGATSVEFTFTTGDPTSGPLLPPWAIIAIAVGGSVVLTVLCVTVTLCLVCCCCKKSCCKRGYTEKYYTGGTIGTMPEEVKTSAETLNSMSHRGSVRGGVIGNYTSVPLTPRSPTIESCDSPYIKQRFESVTDSDGSRSDIHVHQQYTPYRHYTYSHSPGPTAVVPAPLKLNQHDRLSRSLTAFDEPISPQDITHQATMV